MLTCYKLLSLLNWNKKRTLQTKRKVNFAFKPNKRPILTGQIKTFSLKNEQFNSCIFSIKIICIDNLVKFICLQKTLAQLKIRKVSHKTQIQFTILYNDRQAFGLSFLLLIYISELHFY